MMLQLRSSVLTDPDEIFSDMIDEVVTFAQSGTRSQNAQLIHEALHFYLTIWLDGVEAINPLFKVRDLIGVGSYAEGTKINKPDEFDFLAVIDDFSKPNLLSIDQEEANFKRGLVKVKVDDDKLRSRCGQLYKAEHLQGFMPLNFPDSDQKLFGHVFIEAILEYVKKNKLKLGFGTGSPTNLQCNMWLPAINSVSLLLEGVDYSVPNVLITFRCNGLEVSVDLSPAIRYYKLEDCFNVQNCAGPALAELVQKRESLLLIGNDNKSDFKITITEAEVEYIKSVMKVQHKKIYILLKYIIKKYKDNVYRFTSFTSYMMKTVCLHHDIKCDLEKPSIRQCFEAVIADLMICAEQGYVISIVDKRIKLILNHLDIDIDIDCRTNILRDMQRLCNLSVDFKTVKAFNKVLEECLQSARQERDKVEKERFELSEKIREERQQRISNFAAETGFQIDEVKRAMDKAVDIPELALAILKKEREDKMLTDAEVNPTSQSGDQVECGDSASERLAESAESSQNDTNQSSSFTTSTCEVIYQRKKTRIVFSSRIF